MNGLRVGVFVGVATVALASCGPMFQTRYTFSPPDDRYGRNCILQCEQSKFQCQSFESERERMCEERRRLEVERCEWDIRRNGREPKWHECGGSSCSSDTERCDAQYRLCYQNCGGRVTAEEVCVANCQQGSR